MSRRPTRWRGAVLVLAVASAGALAMGFGSPADLFGSAPPDATWTATAAAVRVVDGETLRLGDRVVRLRGLDAPARGSTCSSAAGGTFDCGAAAAERLAVLVAGRPLSCRLHGRDDAHRALGACEAAGLDLNAALVADGYAVSDGAGDAFLAARETSARTARAGLWSGPGTPEAWRNRR